MRLVPYNRQDDICSNNIHVSAERHPAFRVSLIMHHQSIAAWAKSLEIRSATCVMRFDDRHIMKIELVSYIHNADCECHS